MKWIENVEKFFLNVEKFFDNVVFIPRLLGAFKVGMNAFNDHLLSHTRERQRLISERLKSEVKNELKNEVASEVEKTEANK